MIPLARSQPVTDEVLGMADPVEPTEVFRFAAPCLCKGCSHYRGEECRLVQRIVQILPAVAADLPACDIRPDCRWWRQEGREACLRCPQVVTANYNPSELMVRAATPDPR